MLAATTAPHLVCAARRPLATAPSTTRPAGCSAGVVPKGALCMRIERGEVVPDGAAVAPGEPDVQVCVYQSLLSRDKFEWVLQKCTEVGVSRFVPVVTRRSIVHKAQRFKPERERRWIRILTEAAEQCGRGRIPQLEQPATFNVCLGEATSLDLCMLASTSPAACSLRQWMKNSAQSESPLFELQGRELRRQGRDFG